MTARIGLIVMTAGVAASAGAQCTAAIASAAAGGRIAPAKAALEKSVGSAWTDSSYHCLGTLLERELRWADARDAYEKAIAANPRSAAHHASLGSALSGLAANASMFEQMSLGRRMIAEYETALGIDSTLVDARTVLAQVYTMAPAMMGGGADKAEAQVVAIARLNAMRGHMARGAFLLSKKDSAGAEQEYLAAVASARDSAAARYRLAAFYRTRQSWAAAFAVYDSVRRRWPKDELLPYGFGVTAAASGQQLEQGDRELRAWIARPSKDATFTQLAIAHYSLGLIAEKRGKVAEAKKEYEAALRFNPDHKDAKQALARMK